MSVENRVAVITGATGGLGRVLAKNLAEMGISLTLISSKEERLADLATELALPEERFLTKALNLRSQNAAESAAAMTIEKFGRVDMLLHFIGGWAGGKTVLNFEAATFSEMLQQHFWSTLYLVQAFTPHLMMNKWGRIVIISSPTAGRPPAKSSPYAVAKAAQETLILGLAEEMKGSGVTANVIRVKTIDVQHQKINDPTTNNTFWSTPEEISAAIMYLISDEADMVNGARIPLYGSP